MKTQLLRKLYDYISFIRYELPSLCYLLDISVDVYSDLDSSLKSLMVGIDNAILERQFRIHFKKDNGSDEET